jgi:L-aminopeptidase/D-esterase-like protein
VRTGVTAIFPKGKKWEPVFAGWFAGNGFGEMTGTPWVVERGTLGGPVMITNTYSVGVEHDAVNAWFAEVLHQETPWHQPVVGEKSDSFLNDALGQHVTTLHAFEALNVAKSPKATWAGSTRPRGYSRRLVQPSRKMLSSQACSERPAERIL